MFSFTGAKIHIYLIKLFSSLVLPTFSYSVLRKNFYRLEDPMIKSKYETIYLNLYPLKRSVYMHTPLFCIKRFILAFSTAFIYRPINITIGIYLFSSIFTIGYNLNWRPMNSRVLQVMDNTNEMFIMLTGYAIIFFS